MIREGRAVRAQIEEIYDYNFVCKTPTNECNKYEEWEQNPTLLSLEIMPDDLWQLWEFTCNKIIYVRDTGMLIIYTNEKITDKEIKPGMEVNIWKVLTK